jgi:glycosyltransferase involved in cell wall biosynthesis
LAKRLRLENSNVVISIRHLDPVYNVEMLIRAAQMILKDMPNTKFIVVGGGSEKERLLRLAKDLEVSENVIFTGRLPNDQIPEYFSIADVYACTTNSDAGLSASTGEAMASGLPVVITDIGDNRKWVEDGVNGYIVQPKDHKALAESIMKLLRNEKLRGEFGRKGRIVIKDRLNYYKAMEGMEKVYKDLMERYKL